jgi:hypothetical protein
MSFPRRAVAATAVAAMAIPTVALAHGGSKAVRVTSGSTTLDLSGLSGVTLAPLGKATGSGTELTFPIARGRTNAAVTRGVIVHRGGVALTKGGKTVRLHRPVAVVTKRAKFLAVRLGRWRTIRAFRLTDLHKDGSTITATLKLTRRAAKLLGAAAGATAGTARTTLG